MIEFVKRVVNETIEKYKNYINVDKENLNKIINFKKFPKSINFRKVLSNNDFLDEMNEFMSLYDKIDDIKKNKVIIMCHNLASTFEDKEDYEEAICFYTISSFYGNPKSMICLIMIYHQMRLFNLYYFYDSHFCKTIDIFNICRKGEHEDFMGQIMKAYSNLKKILEDLNGANHLINLNK
jgi:hypothetical protein